MVLAMLCIADTSVAVVFIDDLTAVESDRMNLAAGHSAE